MLDRGYRRSLDGRKTSLPGLVHTCGDRTRASAGLRPQRQPVGVVGLAGAPDDAAAVVTGSHLDSVPDGGAFDGPLGVASAFAAIDLLRERDFVPARPVAVAAFTEEEGARFGVACLGSQAAHRRDRPRTPPARCATPTGSAWPRRCGGRATTRRGGPGRGAAAPASAPTWSCTSSRAGALADLDAAVGIAEGIWPHGRWRLDFTGRADHAGTTRLADRHDPMLPYAAAVLAAREAAAAHGRWPRSAR